MQGTETGPRGGVTPRSFSPGLATHTQGSPRQPTGEVGSVKKHHEEVKSGEQKLYSWARFNFPFVCGRTITKLFLFKSLEICSIHTADFSLTANTTSWGHWGWITTFFSNRPCLQTIRPLCMFQGIHIPAVIPPLYHPTTPDRFHHFVSTAFTQWTVDTDKLTTDLLSAEWPLTLHCYCSITCIHWNTVSVRPAPIPSSLVPILLWDPAPVVSLESWPVQTASRREQLDVVSLRLRHSPLTVESAFLQAPPAPGSTHRLWLLSRPRTGGLFKGDSWEQ